MPLRVVITVIAAALVAALSRNCSADDFADFRGLWVSRFEYSANSASSIDQVMANAANMGITDVLFQVRGKGDAYYNSLVEPRAEGTSSSVDPLQVAIASAHARGMRLHAWINTTPLWRDTAAPVSAQHSFYHTNPSFRVTDSNGNLEDPLSPNGAYASFNPVLPEVHTHIQNVVSDIATRYAVDGVHLDYIRWIGNTSASQGYQPDWNLLPHDALSHQLFQQATGLDGASFANAAAYRGFVRDRITDLVEGIRTTIDAAKLSTGRSIDLSAAVWRDPDIARTERLQDYEDWLERDLLDIVMPMIYLSSSNDNLFVPNLTNTLSVPSQTKVAPGIGAYLHTASGGGVDLTVSQLERAEQYGADGATFYSYSSFFGDSLGSARRTAIADFYDALVNPPPAVPTMLASFESSETPFGWSPTFSGTTQGVLAGTTIDRVTDTAWEGTGSQRLSIVGSDAGWILRHVSGSGSATNAANPAGNTPIAAEGYLGLWAKSTTPGVKVRIALDDPVTADRSTEREIIADGLWRLYEWNLDDVAAWEAWLSADGTISGPTVTIDSLQFTGTGNATLWIDALQHLSSGSLLTEVLPGDFGRDGAVGAEDLAIWQTNFGRSVPAGTFGDANGDGLVDGADLVLWRDNLGRSALPAAGSLAAANVPEPVSAIGLLFAIALASGRCRRAHVASRA